MSPGLPTAAEAPGRGRSIPTRGYPDLGVAVAADGPAAPPPCGPAAITWDDTAKPLPNYSTGSAALLATR